MQKRLKQYITEHSPYGFKVKGKDIYFATYRNSKGKATDYTDYQGTIQQWKYELECKLRKVG